jgi:PAS domain S-box-containing protein
LLEAVIRNDHPIHDYEVEHDFPAIGRRIMRLNASPVLRSGHDSHLILLAIEDITERRQVATAVAVSETRYRRLFETAQDAILIVDAVTGRIQDANPFIEQTLGYRQDELVGKELWEIGFFPGYCSEPNGVRRAATERLYPLRSLAARNQEREAGRGRIRQQRLPGGSPASRSVQHSGHNRAHAPGAARRMSRRRR